MKIIKEKIKKFEVFAYTRESHPRMKEREIKTISSEPIFFGKCGIRFNKFSIKRF